MKTYYVIESNKYGDEFEQLKTTDVEEAKKTARYFQNIEDNDRNGGSVEIRVYVGDIENEECECFDYDTIDF